MMMSALILVLVQIAAPEQIACSCFEQKDACPGYADGYAAYGRFRRQESDGTEFSEPLLAHPGAATAFRSAFFSEPNASPANTFFNPNTRRIRPRYWELSPQQEWTRENMRPWSPIDTWFVFESRLTY